MRKISLLFLGVNSWMNVKSDLQKHSIILRLSSCDSLPLRTGFRMSAKAYKSGSTLNCLVHNSALHKTPLTPTIVWGGGEVSILVLK